jgi:hypothetical protein
MGAPMKSLKRRKPSGRSLQESIRALLKSVKFLKWRPNSIYAKVSSDRFTQEDPKARIRASEQHFTPDELAELWGVSAQTIRDLFKEEVGVLRMVKDDKPKNKRVYVTMRIPESVAERVHARLSAVPA